MKKLSLMMLAVFVFGVSFQVAFAAVEANTIKVRKERAYPGGRDEDDLAVQETVIPPTTTTDRQSIEQKVLKSNFKKNDEETENNQNPQ